MKKSKFVLFFVVSILAFALSLSVCGANVSEGDCGNGVNYSVSSDGILTVSGNGNISDYLPSNTPWSAYTQSITSLKIFDGVKSIGTCAFVNINVKKVTVPDSVISIGSLSLGYTHSGDKYSKISEFTICGSDGSEAQRYANSNGFIFEKSASGTSGKIGTLSWSISTDGALIVSGNGDIPGFENGSLTPWADYRNGKDGYTIKKVVITDGVTSIGNHAFESSVALTSVTVPSTVKEIGIAAFADCFELSDISISSGITSIQNEAFSQTKIKKISLPSTVKSVGTKAFYGCSALENVDMTGATSIGEKAFASCTSLETVNVGSSLAKIGTSAFEECRSLNSFEFKEPLNTIGNRAFLKCKSLTSVHLPDTLTSLGSYAFSECSSLSDISFGNGLSDIPQGAFENCVSLKQVSVGSSVKNINELAFLDCTSLSEITIPLKTKYIAPYSIGYTFSNNEYIPSNNLVIKGYTPSFAMSYAEENGFGFVSTGTSSGGSGKVNDSISWSFDMSSGVLVVDGNGVIPDSVTANDIPWHIFRNYIKKVKLNSDIIEIGDSAFSNCSLLSEIEGTDNIKRIGSYSFNNTALTEFICPINLSEIGVSAFEGCTQLQNVTLNENLQRIDDYAFRGDDNLKSIYVYKNTSVGYNALGFMLDDTFVDGFKLNGVKGSMAESYAENCGIAFVEEGFTKLTDERNGAAIEFIDQHIDNLILTFDNISENISDSFFFKNETDYVKKYRFSLTTQFGTKADITGNITYYIPANNFDRMTLRIFVQENDKFISVPFEYSSGMIKAPFNRNADLIMTNVDLSNVVAISVDYKFEDGTQAHEPTVAFAVPGAEYNVRSAWIEGFHATKQTFTGTAEENISLSFVYVPDDKNSENNNSGKSSVGKTILIIVCIIIAVAAIVAIVFLVIYNNRKKHDEDEKSHLADNKDQNASDPLASTIIIPEITKKELDIESLFADDPEEDVEATRKAKKETKKK